MEPSEGLTVITTRMAKKPRITVKICIHTRLNATMQTHTPI